ncbi:MAG: GAF domain-containing protein [Saprospirales bacterium]|nr:MAG: GAF domain-containing protein [Saprospirales bacterium]
MESSLFSANASRLRDMIDSGFLNSLREGVIIFDIETREPFFFNKVITNYTGWEVEKFDLETVNQFLPETQIDGKPSNLVLDNIFKQTIKKGHFTLDVLLDLKYRMLYVNVNSFYLAESNALIMLFDDTKIPLDAGPFEIDGHNILKYRRLNESRLGSYEYDFESRTFSLSKVAREILDIGKKKNINWEDLKEIIPDYQIKSFLETTKRAIETSSTFEVMHQIIGSEEKWVLNWGRPEKNRSGKVSRLKGVFQDISQKIQEERTLRYNEVIERTIRTLLSEIIIHDEEEKLYSALIKKMSTMLNFEDCVIYIWDPSIKKLVQKVKYSVGDIEVDLNKIEKSPVFLELGEGIVGSVAKKRRAEIVEDIKNDPRYIKDKKVRGSEMAVPILVEGNLIGVIDTEHRQVGFYNRYHLKVLETIASILGVKVVQVRAQKEIWKRKQMLQGTIDSLKDSGVFTLDKNYRVIAFNSTHRDNSIKYSGDEVGIGKKIDEVITDKKWLNILKGHFRALFSKKTDFITFVEKAVSRDRDTQIIQVGIGSHKAPNGDVFALTVLYQDITEREKYLEAFKKSEAREREMERLLKIRKAENALQFYRGREDERQRIAMTLHDEVANGVAALILMLDNLKPENKQTLTRRLGQFSEGLKEVYEKTRQLSHNLVNSSLDYGNFCSEIEELIKVNLGNGTRVNFFISDHDAIEGFNKHLKNELLLIFSELSINLAKHANAKSVNVNLLVENGCFSAVLEDDGIGFQKSKPGKGMGLKNIKKRVELLDGIFNIDSVPGKGTIALIEFPIQ